MAEAIAEAIAAIGAASDLGLDPERTLEHGLDGALAAFGAPAGGVYVKRPTSGELELSVHRSAGTLAPSFGDDRSQVVEALQAGRTSDASGLGLTGAVVAPLRASGETAGALVLAVDPELAPAVAAVARALALALRSAQLFRGLQERARDLDRQVRQLMALTEVARGVTRSLDASAVRETVVEEARRLVRADAAALVSYDDAGRLRTDARGGAEGAGDTPDPGAIPGLAADPGVPGRAGRVARVPVHDGDRSHGRGALVVWRIAGAGFSEDDLERLEGLGDQATVALTNARLLSHLRHEKAERERLAARMVEAQEQERRRVAEDIHDGPVQELVALGLMLDALRGESGDSPLGEGIASAGGAAREVIRELRQAIFDLHPMSLDELRFTAATRTAATRLEEQGVEVELDLDAADTLVPTQRTVAFRVVQEAVANVVRHAAASRVVMQAVRDGDAVEVTVRDDGIGFDAAGLTNRIGGGHLGLPAMQERAAMVGGELSVESAPGEGTTVRLRLREAPAAG